MNDTKLDSYLASIYDSDDIHQKIVSYKKATRRINTLKSEYIELCNLLNNHNVKKKKKVTELSINDIIEKINEIEESINKNEVADIRESIENFIEYKKLLDQFDSYTENLKNTVFKVNNDCTFEKIELNDLIN